MTTLTLTIIACVAVAAVVSLGAAPKSERLPVRVRNDHPRRR